MLADLSEYVFASKYSRGASWEDSVDRIMDLHGASPLSLEAEAAAKEKTQEIREAYKQKRIAGSQRGLQFGASAIKEKNARLYNCVSSYCDRPEFFKECFWLLLCGCGTGFSVQKHHIAQLPSIKEPKGTFTYYVEDSIEGWANACHALLSAYFFGEAFPLFNFEQIRERGTPLRHGGQAPGFKGLFLSLRSIRNLIHPLIGSKLEPIHAFDITMYLAEAVMSGGVRRSATIAVFSPSDKDMARSKTGDWFKTNPQRSNANISSLVSGEKDFTEFFNYAKEFGEPAFLFSESSEYLYNPCVEIGMCPTLIKSNGVIVQQYTPQLLDPTRRSEWEALGYTYQSGWQACNLTTINCIKNPTEQLFLEAVALATHLGTLQASYTSFPFLGDVTEQIVRREALLGVSMTGILTNPMFYDHDMLQKGQRIARLTNRAVSQELGINEASRICCVKPEGTASIVLGTSAGIHPYHSSQYIRRVQADRDEPLYQQVHKTHPEACEDSVYGDDNQVVIAFPCEAPPNALTRADLSAVQHLEIAKKVNIGWVRQKNDMGLQHNVSITVTVSPHEWDEVRDYIWENREYFTGIALLSSSPDYEQPPYEEVLPSPLCVTEKQKKARALFDLLVSLPPLNLLSSLHTTSRNNNPLDNPACVSGVCDLEYNYD